LSYSSFISPPTIYDYHFPTKRLIIRKQNEIPNYNPKLYKSEIRKAIASDGTEIRMSVVYRIDKHKEVDNNVLLVGYGSYGVSYDPFFDYKRLPLLDRGIVYVIAHIRGGGEMGRQWYDAGKLLQKKNTFTDFISCAENLINSKFTSPCKLAISGGSAGGLLVGAVLNMRPELFKTCYTRVPFVDVICTMSDPSIPLTVMEYEEWGNPGEEKYYEYISSYSPYDNVREQKYPSMLVTAGLHDNRVGYWEPAKWVAKLRYHKLDNNVILFKCQTVGHGGSSGRYSFLDEEAFKHAFLLDQLGLYQKKL